MYKLNFDKEICKSCGDSVKRGSGKFINRIPDCNDYKTRVSNGDKYPHGEYICEDCDSARDDD